MTMNSSSRWNDQMRYIVIWYVWADLDLAHTGLYQIWSIFYLPCWFPCGLCFNERLLANDLELDIKSKYQNGVFYSDLLIPMLIMFKYVIFSSDVILQWCILTFLVDLQLDFYLNTLPAKSLEYTVYFG